MRTLHPAGVLVAATALLTPLGAWPSSTPLGTERGVPSTRPDGTGLTTPNPSARATPAQAPPPRATPAQPPPPRARDGFLWPVPPPRVVLRRFAPGPHRWSPGHRGVDLATTPSERLTAPARATVTFSGTIAGRGVVVLQHRGGLRTTYEAVRALLPRGTVVDSGRVFAVIEGTTRHCPAGPCLHWGAVRRSAAGTDTYLDPLSLLGREGPVVLLPLRHGAGDPAPAPARAPGRGRPPGRELR